MGHMTQRSAELLREYISRPTGIMAVQITDENAEHIAQMVGGKVYKADKDHPALRIYFHCCNARVKAGWGDWIIQKDRGFFVMTNDEFSNGYREAA